MASLFGISQIHFALSTWVFCTYYIKSGKSVKFFIMRKSEDIHCVSALVRLIRNIWRDCAYCLEEKTSISGAKFCFKSASLRRSLPIIHLFLQNTIPKFPYLVVCEGRNVSLITATALLLSRRSLTWVTLSCLQYACWPGNKVNNSRKFIWLVFFVSKQVAIVWSPWKRSPSVKESVSSSFERKIFHAPHDIFAGVVRQTHSVIKFTSRYSKRDCFIYF